MPAGVPNYFGLQRFGRGGANIALADQWSQGKRLPRHQRSFAISAARSYLFNQQLDSRVRDGSWNQLIAGDVANLDGSGSVFAVTEPDAELNRRCLELDVHPTGTLFGDGSPPTSVSAGHEGWLKALKDARVKPARRSLGFASRISTGRLTKIRLRLDVRVAMRRICHVGAA